MTGFLDVRFARPPGRPLASFRQAGSGPALLLLHGWPQTSYEWRKVAPLFVDAYTVVAPDMRGLGDCERPLGGYDKMSVAADALALCDMLGLGSLTVVAHDMGVPVAYALARAEPERVRRMAMLDVPPIVPAQAFAGFAPWHFGFHGVADLPEALVAGRERLYLRYWYAGAYPTALTEADLDEYARTYAAPGAMRAGFGYYRAFVEDLASFADAREAKLPMPVLALHGARSPLGDLVHRVAAEICADLRTGVIADCGHWIPEEQPEALASALRAFFAETGDAP